MRRKPARPLLVNAGWHRNVGNWWKAAARCRPAERRCWEGTTYKTRRWSALPEAQAPFCLSSGNKPLLNQINRSSSESATREQRTMIMTMRGHKRFAVRQSICLRRLLDGSHASGLMIELSSEGCRISGLGSCDFLPDDQIIVERENMKLRGRIRWINLGIAGIRLDRLLLPRELDSYLCRLRGLEVPDGSAIGTNEQEPLRRAG